MNLVGMEVFVRVVEARSFSGAARRLKVSKSVVSKQVARLERVLGVQLLTRTTRTFGLTEIGHEFYERCTAVVAAAEQAETSAMRLQAEPRGTVRVAAPVSFGTLHVAPVLHEFLTAYPDLRVEMTLTNRSVNLAEEGLDLCIIGRRELQPGLVARALACVPRQVCAAPAYLAKRGLPAVPADLVEHNCLLHSGGSFDRKWHFQGPHGAISVSVNGNLMLDELNAVRFAAGSGAGVALLPAYVVAQDIREGSLVALLAEFAPENETIHAVYPPSRHLARKVRAFVDFLIERFAGTSRWDVAG